MCSERQRPPKVICRRSLSFPPSSTRPSRGRARAAGARSGDARGGVSAAPARPGPAMDAALPEAEREVVVAAEPCGHGSKFEDIYRLLAEGCFPPSFCSIKRKNLKRYAQKFVVDGGDPGGGAAVSGWPGPRPAPGAACGGKPAPLTPGMCRSLGAGRGGEVASGQRHRRHRSPGSAGDLASPQGRGAGIVSPPGGTGAPRLPRGDRGGFVAAEDFTRCRVQKSSVGVRGGDSGLAASPGAAAAPELFQPCFPVWKLSIFLEASSCERALLETNLWHPQAAASTTWDPRRRRSAR